MSVITVKNEAGIRKALKDLSITSIKIDGQPLMLIPRTKRNGATWYVIFYSKGKKQRSIGKYPEFSLDDAIKMKASIAKDLIENKPKSESVKFDTVGDLLKWFEASLKSKKEHRRISIKSAIKNHLTPFFGHLSIEGIKKEHIYEFFRQQEDDNCKPSSTKLRFFILKQAFIQASKIDLIESNIFINTKVTDFTELKAKAREGRLKKRHIKKAYSAISEIKSSQIKLFNMLCLMHGTRLTETRMLTWKEVDFENKEFTLLAENVKNGEEHVIPMTKQIFAMFKDYQKKQSKSYKGKFVFNSGDSCISDSRAKSYVAMASAAGGFKWSCHDYRKLVKSMMTELKVTDFVSERIINHKMSGIHLAYTQGELKKLMLDALKIWHNYLDKFEQKKMTAQKYRKNEKNIRGFHPLRAVA